jgi:DNA repair exonuclease SbcCD ATPase subunit
MVDIRNLRSTLDQLKGKKINIQSELERLDQRILNNKRALIRQERAREVVRQVGIKTVRELEFHISNIATLALESVFENPSELMARFVERRNRLECDIYLQDSEGERIDPMDESGGSVVNITSFALRIASWTMGRPRSNNFIVMDEPFNNVPAELQGKVSAMLHEISERLELQLIIVTHSPELMESADRTFKISKVGKVSVVEN